MARKDLLEYNAYGNNLKDPGITVALLYKAMVKKGLRQSTKENDNFSSLILNGSSISPSISQELDSYDESDFIGNASMALYCLKDFKKDLCSGLYLTQLTNQLFALKEDDIVYDLGTGYGDYLINLIVLNLKSNINIHYMGTECDRYRLGVLKLLGAIFNYKMDIKFSNALENETIYFDKGYCFPPLAVRTYASTYHSALFKDMALNNRLSSEWVFSDKLLSGLKDHGKAMVIMSNGALYNSSDKAYRDALLDKGLIEGIIELPSKTVDDISASLSLVIFSYNNKVVKALDATQMIKLDDSFTTILDNERIYNEYLKAKEYTIEELKSSSNIVPSSLTKKDYIYELKTNTRINDVAVVFNGCQYTISHFKDDLMEEETGFKILTSKDIEDGCVDWLHLQDINLDDTKLYKYILFKNDIVITSKSSKVKIAIFDKDMEEKVIVTGGMLVIRPDSDKVDSTFIKMYLESKDGQKALEAIQKGSIITTINAVDLSLLPLPDTSLEEQKELANAYNDKLNQLTKLRKEVSLLEKELNNLYDINK